MNPIPTLELLTPWLLRTSLQVGLLVLVILVLQRAFGRWLSPRARYGLWLLVVLRLCVPVQVEVVGGSWLPSPSSAREVAREPEPEAVLPESASLTLLKSRSERAAKEFQVEPTAPEQEPRADDLAAQVAPSASQSSAALAAVRSAPGAMRSAPMGRSLPNSSASQVLASQGPGAAQARSAAELSNRPWVQGLLWLWLAGCLLSLTRSLLAELRFRRRLAGAQPVTSTRVLQALEEAREAIGLRAQVPCVQTDALQSPAVYGFWRKRLLLPGHVLESFEVEELRLLFLHELSHVRRRDVELNLLLVLLSGVFWFHPLVHLALSRLRGAQEALRDWEALASSAHPSPRLYAGTLIKLVERIQADPRPARGVGFLLHGRSLKERILMIAHFSSPRTSKRYLGGLLSLPLLWIAFTSSAESKTPPQEARALSGLTLAAGGAHATQASLREIVVASHQELPAWQRKMQEQLQTRVSFELRNVTLEEVVEKLRELNGMNYVLSSDVREEGGDWFDLGLENTTIGEALDLICRSLNSELGYCLVGESVYIGYRHELPRTYLTYVYNIAELMQDLAIDDREQNLELLTDLVYSCVQSESWDSGPASISAWGELMVISQTAEVQARVESFLNLLLNRGATPELPLDEREAELRERLDQLKVNVHYRELSLSKVASDLHERYGLEVFVHPDYVDHEITLTLRDIRLESMLGFLASSSGLNLWTQRGRIYLTEGWDATSIAGYPIGDLLQNFSAETGLNFEEGMEDLVDIIRESVAPESWDNWGELWSWNNLLIVRQSEATHAELKAFLGDLRSAIR